MVHGSRGQPRMRNFIRPASLIRRQGLIGSDTEAKKFCLHLHRFGNDASARSQLWYRTAFVENREVVFAVPN